MRGLSSRHWGQAPSFEPARSLFSWTATGKTGVRRVVFPMRTWESDIRKEAKK